MSDYDQDMYADFLNQNSDTATLTIENSSVKTDVGLDLKDNSVHEKLKNIGDELPGNSDLPKVSISNDKEFVIDLTPDVPEGFKSLTDDIKGIDKEIQRYETLNIRVIQFGELLKEKSDKEAKLESLKKDLGTNLKQNIAGFSNSVAVKNNQVSIIKPSIFNNVLTKLGLKKETNKALSQQLNNVIYNKAENKPKLDGLMPKSSKGKPMGPMTDNADKIAEDMLMSILNAGNLGLLKTNEQKLGQEFASNTKSAESSKQLTPENDKESKNLEDTIKVLDGKKTYKFIGYNSDHTQLQVKDEKGLDLFIPNTSSLKISHNKPLTFSKTQNDLISADKVTTIRLKNGGNFQTFTASKVNSQIELKPLSEKQFNILQKSEQQSQKQGQNPLKKQDYGLKLKL